MPGLTFVSYDRCVISIEQQLSNRGAMVFGTIISSPRASLSLQQVLRLANVYLENARQETDETIALVLCHDAEVSLSQVKRVAKHTKDKDMREGIASIYDGLGDLLDNQGCGSEAQAFYNKSAKWSHRVPGSGQSSRSTSLRSSLKNVLHSRSTSTAETPADKTLPLSSAQSPHKQQQQERDLAVFLPADVFPTNVRPPTVAFNPPEQDARLNDTIQLACCLGLLQSGYEPDDILDPAVLNWLQVIKDDPDEQERLKTLATDVIRAFKRDELKDAKSVTEVVILAPVLENDDFRYVLKEFYSGIGQSDLLDIHQLEGLAHLVQNANSGAIDADDLVKVLSLLSTRLRDTHQQSTHHLHQLTMAVSHVLDAMADANVKGLDRKKIHEPLSLYLEELKKSSDSYLVYQAAYAYQALLCVPDDESLWQATLRRGGKVIQGVSGIVSAVKGLDLNGFVEGLKDIQQGMSEAGEAIQLVKKAYDGATSLIEDGQGFFECLKEGLSFGRKCAWYSALRGADVLIREGQLASFKRLVCEAPCRREAAFQWGVCQRLGVIAADSKWDLATRQNAVAFLGEMYRDDDVWGSQSNIKQWIVNILMQLSSIRGGEMQFVKLQLQGLAKKGDSAKQKIFQTFQENGPVSYPLKIALSTVRSPSLLDRVQERPDVEGHIRQLRKQRLKDRGTSVYIAPQAKASLQAPDEARFPLMEKVDEFLANDQKVFLLLGDSGAGKSTFNHELECHLWQSYKKAGVIPLHINLPAIDKPEHDMVAKQLRKFEFTEPQIRELKLHRKFTLICDGYDESQQTHNLYRSNRLNQVGEWDAKMVISCRSEYLGEDYRDRFQPGDRNHRSEPLSFQEAVITPFSMDQVYDYITQYVSVYRPLWEAAEYKNTLDLIPSLKDLVKNPFLMSLSLEVLPRMVDPGHDLSTTHITRTALYDQFIEHWLERGKKRLGEKTMSEQARSAFENLIDEGFTRNGIDYLKKLSVAIYKEQDGQPIVSYSRYKDEKSWKGPFFSRDEEKQILREACPLKRNGNQHRFIHRSLLEYGVALAIFDPQDWKERMVPETSAAQQTSTGPELNSSKNDNEDEASAVIGQEPEFISPLTWRSFIKEPSTLQFLEERVSQEPVFKQLLYGYIEQSKKDKKWSTAASNAITILIRAGYQFNHKDLRGIQIPNADLSYGMFESAQLQGADLRNVDLRGTWMRNVNLSNSQMTGVQFGEMPYLKHDSVVRMCVYSPDGENLAVGLENGKVIVYSTSNCETLWTLDGHNLGITGLVYSPEGDGIASSSEDGTVRLWNTGTGGCNHIVNGHGGGVTSVVYSSRGDQIASGSRDLTVRLWDVFTGECHHIWIGHTKDVLGVVYSPKRAQIASHGEDCTVRLWDIEAKKCIHVLSEHSHPVMIVVYSSQGDQLVSACTKQEVRIWEVDTGECRHSFKGDFHLYSNSCAFMYSPIRDQVARMIPGASVQLWDADTGKLLRKLDGDTHIPTSIVYSPQGDMIASAGDDNAVRIWDTETGVRRQTLIGHSDYVSIMAFSPKGDQIASGSYDTTVRLWDVGATTSRQISIGHSRWIHEIKCSPKGDSIATCSDDKTARIWDVETGICRHILQGHSGDLYSIAYSPQGDQIATGSEDSTVRLWNIETGACTHTLTGHDMAVYAVRYSPQGHQLASASYDRTVRLWDVRRSSGLRRRRRNGASMDIATGECRHIFIGHQNSVKSVAYSPRGDQIASGSEDGLLKLWGVEARTCLWTLTGHTERVNNVAYSPRGDMIVSTSWDKSMRLWDVTSGQCRAVIQHYKSGAKDIAWIEASGINYFVVGCEDGSVGMWQVRNDGDHCHVSLRWTRTKGELDVKGATIQGMQGLSHLDKQLLKQRGAVGEPADRFREASKKVSTMASVVSHLKTPLSEPTEDSTSKVSVSFEQLLQRVEQSNDPLLRDVVAAFVKNIH
ncbi:MAG: WD40-repeat-containing domain protein [Benniella sp.]|nr:MAG: WD40-repeat-containing domain protein [Benniella sp.]